MVFLLCIGHHLTWLLKPFWWREVNFCDEPPWNIKITVINAEATTKYCLILQLNWGHETESISMEILTRMTKYLTNYSPLTLWQVRLHTYLHMNSMMNNKSNVDLLLLCCTKICAIVCGTSISICNFINLATSTSQQSQSVNKEANLRMLNMLKLNTPFR